MADDRRTGLVPALLKQWRAQRGLSQLDLAAAADVSVRHVSFLETGRSLPSPEMVLRLGAALGAPLGQVDLMLVAAGHDPVHGGSTDAVPPPVAEALELLKAHHEPYPLVVVDRSYRVRDVNDGAVAVLGAVLGELPAGELNLARLTFDPGGAQPYLVNFDEVGRQLLWRLQREVLADPADEELRSLLEDLLAAPTVSEDWRDVDLSVPSEPALVLHLRRDELDLRFLTAVTAFQAPQNLATEQILIEQWFPYDDATAAACRRLAGSDGTGSG